MSEMKNALERSLVDVVSANEVVLLLVRTMAFGHKLGRSALEVGNRFLDIVEKAFGPERTIVLAAFYPLFARTKVFDLKQSRPSTGVAAAAAVGRPGWIRTRTPMNSYVVRGPRADQLANLACTTAWGADGVLAWLTEVNARVLLVGIPEANNGWLIVHRAEEELLVPYRYFKRFAGEVLSDGHSIGSVEEVLYVTPRMVDIEHDHSGISRALTEQGLESVSSEGGVIVRAADCRSVHQVGLSLLREDPYAFVANPDVVREWVRHDKASEVSNMPEENRWTNGA